MTHMTHTCTLSDRRKHQSRLSRWAAHT